MARNNGPALTPEIILDRAIPEPTSGCWLWVAGKHNNGYGRIRVDATAMLAHRASWTTFSGAILDGQLVLHKCDNRACVNPQHLYLGSYLDNARDRVARNRQPRKAACPKGHPYSEVNLYTTPSKGRRCRLCAMAAMRRYWVRRVAAAREAGCSTRSHVSVAAA